MKIYFIRHNNESLGPYSIEELKNLGVTKHDYVWKEGFATWYKAGEVGELSELFSNTTPPPFTEPKPAPPPIYQPSYYQPASTTEKVGFRIGKFLGWTGIIVILIIVTAYIVNSSQGSTYNPSFTNRPKTPEELRAELLEQERQNPSQYLVDNVTMRSNLIGEKVFEGTITNNASVAVFKDIVLEIEFLSKTDAVIDRNRFVIYEVLTPKQSKRFKFKTFASKDTKGFGASVVDATAVR